MAERKIVQTATMGFSEKIITLRSRFETGKEGHRTYDGLTLRPGELVADRMDEIGIVFYVHNEIAKDPNEVLRDFAIKKLTFTFTHDAAYLYDFKEDVAYQQPGEKRYTLKTINTLAYTQSNAELITIDATAELESTKASKKETMTRKRDVTFAPCYIYTKLWVVPGRMKHTSEAGACVGLRLARPPYFTPKNNMKASLVITNPGGGPQMSIVDSNGVEVSGEDTPVKDGLVKWTVRYRGMTLDNVAGADFTLQVQIHGMAKMATVRFNVGRNLVDFLNDLNQSASSLQLTNPEFQNQKGLDALVDYAWPDQMVGIAYNARDFFASLVGYEAPVSWHHYTCGEFSRRLCTWAHERRFGHRRYTFDTAQQMNGIEFGEYSIRLLHVFFGFSLSGVKPPGDDDMCFIDPWWDQAYDDHVMLSPAEEQIRLYAAATFLASAGPIFVYFVGKILAAAMLRIAPSITSAILNYLWCQIQKTAWRKVAISLDVAALFGSVVFQVDYFSDTEWFEDQPGPGTMWRDQTTYSHFPKKWLEDQSSTWLRQHAGGRDLPYME